MATEVVRDLADTIIGNKDTVEAMEIDLESNSSAATVILVDDVPGAACEKLNLEEPSDYTMTCESGYSRDVERWMRGDVSPIRAPPLHHSRVRTHSGDSPPPPPLQLASNPECCGLGALLAALALPFAGLTNTIPPHWISWYQANGSTCGVWVKNMTTHPRFHGLVSKLGAMMSRACWACARVQCHVQRAAGERALRDVFAAAMDAVLVAYAVGFLLLSLCQASLIGF